VGAAPLESQQKLRRLRQVRQLFIRRSETPGRTPLCVNQSELFDLLLPEEKFADEKNGGELAVAERAVAGRHAYTAFCSEC